MISVSQLEEAMREVLQEEANRLAKETGFVQRERKLSGASFVQMLVFGWLQSPEARLDELTQMGQVCQVDLSCPGVSKRFTPQAASFLKAVLERLVQRLMSAEAVEIPLLKRFSAVIMEDSSIVSLPDELKEVWRGSGGNQVHTEAGIKLHVRFDLLHGTVQGPRLSDARCSDYRSPFNEEPVVPGSVYCADEGYYGLKRLQARAQAQGYFVVRPKSNAAFFDRQGQRMILHHLLPRHVGQSKQLHVLVGTQVRLPVRLLLLRVPAEVAEQRREQIREQAHKHSTQPSEEQLYLADWTIIITNVPAKLLALEDALVILRARWQLELLFKLWKQHGLIDEWRTKKRWRILCELYGKLMAMVIQHWLIQHGLWHEPHRSLVKAARRVRRWAQALLEGLVGTQSFAQVLTRLVRSLRSGCRLDTRSTSPNTSQLLLGGLEWPLS